MSDRINSASTYNYLSWNQVTRKGYTNITIFENEQTTAWQLVVKKTLEKRAKKTKKATKGDFL